MEISYNKQWLGTLLLLKLLLGNGTFALLAVTPCQVKNSDHVHLPFKTCHYGHPGDFMTNDQTQNPPLDQQDSRQINSRGLTRRNTLAGIIGTTTSTALFTQSTLSSLLIPPTAMARPESLNRPDLLPKEPGLNVIQIEKFLTSGQAKRLDQLLEALERDTGFRVRVLCQAYPYTPGLAIRDYWDLGKEDQKDDKYVVLVADQFGGKGNVLNFNVGDGVKLVLPNIFWNRLSNAYGTIFYVRENGIDLAIINAIEAVVSCLRSEDFCVNIPDTAPSMKSLGMS